MQPFSRFRIISLLFLLVLLVASFALFGAATLAGHAAGAPAANNCGSWKTAPSTNVPSSNNYLNGVAVLDIAASDVVTHVWAVGYFQDSNGHNQTLIEHRGKTTWSVVSSQNPGVNNVLTAVTAISGNDAWAVGYSYTTDPSVDGQTLIEHRTGSGSNWVLVPSPNPGASNTLNAITQIPNSTNLLAVGSSDGGTLIAMWDGTSWSTVPSPNPLGTSITLTGVTALSTNLIWAVGYYTDSNGLRETLTERWNGSTWNIVASQNVAGANGSVLTGAARVFSSTHVWAVGYSYTTDPVTNTTTYQTLTEFWNGTSWSAVASPNVGSSALNAVAVVTANDVVAIGYSTNTSGATQTLIQRWNGTTWSIVSSPDIGSGNNMLRGIGRVAGNNAFFAVGNYYKTNPALNQTLVETFCH